MKQHITVEQLNELSDKGKEKLRKWWKPRKGDWMVLNNLPRLLPQEGDDGGGITWDDLRHDSAGFTQPLPYPPLLSIGQMIEFLYEEKRLSENDWGEICLPSIFKKAQHESVCDDLWEATKQALEDL